MTAPIKPPYSLEYNPLAYDGLLSEEEFYVLVFKAAGEANRLKAAREANRLKSHSLGRELSVLELEDLEREC